MTEPGLGRHLGIFSCTLLMYVLTNLYCVAYAEGMPSKCGTRDWNWYILYTLNNITVFWVCRRLASALGRSVFVLPGRIVCLDGVWNYDSSIGRREELHRSSLSS